ncbi:GPW/gp25 family protein [Massilia sp. CCM 8734]|uniref:GPW/gp25 family protein n=1 Tax=Massilia sp. CCM 8734 TaxID=2609283 RepID=UPI00141F3F2C|nr:GPW/gp25 family protein [Massilia sp. CCM 8734]NIA00863.1 baseplate assembly protein [Massilia sp. CCM 8734]
MKGMNRSTGRSIGGLEHLYQSIAKILSTPRGSRIERRGFGSDLYQLVDAPNNPATQVRIYAAAATALMQWEPRLKVTRIGLSIDPAAPGTQVIDIYGTTNISREAIATSVTLTSQRTA